jgi:hypothetical protein
MPDQRPGHGQHSPGRSGRRSILRGAMDGTRVYSYRLEGAKHGISFGSRLLSQSLTQQSLGPLGHHRRHSELDLCHLFRAVSLIPEPPHDPNARHGLGLALAQKECQWSPDGAGGFLPEVLSSRMPGNTRLRLERGVSSAWRLKRRRSIEFKVPERRTKVVCYLKYYRRAGRTAIIAAFMIGDIWLRHEFRTAWAKAAAK